VARRSGDPAHRPRRFAGISVTCFTRACATGDDGAFFCVIGHGSWIRDAAPFVWFRHGGAGGAAEWSGADGAMEIK
jgi:hypothetical protein